MDIVSRISSIDAWLSTRNREYDTQTLQAEGTPLVKDDRQKKG